MVWLSRDHNKTERLPFFLAIVIPFTAIKVTVVVHVRKIKDTFVEQILVTLGALEES